MATTINVVTKGARGLWPIIRKMLSINFFAIILILIFVYSVVISIEQGSLEPMVNGVGGRAFFALDQLNTDSLAVLSDDYLGLSMWKKTKLILSISGSFMFMFIWVKILAGIVARSIFSGDVSRWLANWSLGLTFFIFLEILFVLVVGTQGYLGEGFEVSQAFTLPKDAAWNFIQTIPVIIEPIISIWDNLFDRTPDIFEANESDSNSSLVFSSS